MASAIQLLERSLGDEVWQYHARHAIFKDIHIVVDV